MPWKQISRLSSVGFTVAALAGASACQRSSDHPPETREARARSAKAIDLGGHKPGAHADHAPQHGGAVLMNGDVHFEVVFDPAGHHRVYFSDAVRTDLPASFAAEVTMTIHANGAAAEALKLTPDPSNAFWEARGKPVDVSDTATTARVAYRRADEPPYWIDLPVVWPVGEGKPVQASDTGPHGGFVKETSSGRLELAAERIGAFKLWLLDASGRARPLTDVRARVKVALEDYPEVALAPAGDHLEGKGGAIDAEHATAVVIVDQGGKSETARFTLHLEGHGHGAHAEN